MHKKVYHVYRYEVGDDIDNMVLPEEEAFAFRSYYHMLYGTNPRLLYKGCQATAVAKALNTPITQVSYERHLAMCN